MQFLRSEKSKVDSIQRLFGSGPIKFHNCISGGYFLYYSTVASSYVNLAGKLLSSSDLSQLESGFYLKMAVTVENAIFSVTVNKNKSLTKCIFVMHVQNWQMLP